MRFEATIPTTAICIGFTIWNFLRAFNHKKTKENGGGRHLFAWG